LLDQLDATIMTY